MDDELSEAQRQEILRTLRQEQPDVDIDGLVAGKLAGPASGDRPPVPVWEYLDYPGEHPELSLEWIVQVRFPIDFFGGGSTVTSIAEHLAPGPHPARFVLDAGDIVRLYRLRHEAGALRWNAETRTHEETMPQSAYVKAVYATWAAELERKATR